MSDLVSVGICTYNRVDLIQGCLDSLADQTADPRTFEVIVIDNNSSDNTLKIVENYTRLPNIRIFCEEKQGLSHARNRGLAEAKGKYIAYLDDDARAECHYVENILKLLEQFSDTVDCFGGPILPFYTTPKPAWFKDEYEARRRNWEAGILKKGQTFSGSNMIWKRITLMGVEGFDTSYGMKGNQLLGGEETNLIERLWKEKQPLLFFSPDLIVYHWVPAYKMSVKYCFKRNMIGGRYLAKANLHHFKTSKRLIRLSLIILNDFVRSIILRHRYAFWQTWVFEEWQRIFLSLGELFGILGFKFHFLQK